MSVATIRPCRCQHDWQDQHYGRGMRVHNVKENKQTGDVRCTVCGATA